MIAETLNAKFFARFAAFKPHRLSMLSIWQDDGYGNAYAAHSIAVAWQADDFIHEGLGPDLYTFGRS